MVTDLEIIMTIHHGQNSDLLMTLVHRMLMRAGLGIMIQKLQKVDKFPLFRYQWKDTDGDWIGDEPNTPLSDGCPNTWGNSTEDRVGCQDTDGDGWSNPSSDGSWAAHPVGDADAFPDDPTQWRDSDGDGFGDNTSGNSPDECPDEYGLSSIDRVGCPDADGDGWSNAGDPFPTDGTQWEDRDNDGYGDNPLGNNADQFPDDSSQWADTDGDGYGDRPVQPNGDFFPNDPTQWSDYDNDGFGDNPEGNNGDQCPELYGQSTIPAARGCPDTDNDGVVDPFDAFPKISINRPIMMEMVGEITRQFQMVMSALTSTGQAPIILDKGVRTVMVTHGQTSTIHSLMIQNNGRIQTLMDLEITMDG